MSTNQQSLFDLPAALAARDAGITLAADNNASLVVKAREIAVEIARRQGTVTADDVQFALVQQGVDIKTMGNSMGGVFRDRRFKWTGRFTKSTRQHSHANLLRIWKLA